MKPWARLLLGAALALPIGAAALDLLAPEQAFRPQARALDPAHIEVSYRIAPGYYLYRKDFAFAVEAPTGASLGEPVFPPAEVKNDPYFGRTEIYRDRVAIRVPLKLSASASAVTLRLTSRGCADQGVCFTPQTQRLKLSLSGTASVTGATGESLQALLGAGTNPAQPPALWEGAPGAASKTSSLPFEGVASTSELDSRLAAAASRGERVMLVLYAGRCALCEALERTTLADPRVRAKLAGVALLRADVTRKGSEEAALLKRVGLSGPPGIVFFDPRGKELPVRVTGYQSPERFLATLDRLDAPVKR